MKSDIKETLEFKNKNWLKAIVMGGILLLPFGKALDAAVEGGAFLKEHSFDDPSFLSKVPLLRQSNGQVLIWTPVFLSLIQLTPPVSK